MSTQSSFETGKKPTPGKRYFTVAEANAALPYVSRIADDISSSYKLAFDLQQRLEKPLPDDDSDSLHEKYDVEVEKLRRCVKELETVGVDLKDHQRGLLDFPAKHEGREILLCWQCGEDAVDHWHEVDEGFKGRQDVSLLG